ncbi:Uncharacterised protein g1526 [Pycnogonum litorale]
MPHCSRRTLVIVLAVLILRFQRAKSLFFTDSNVRSSISVRTSFNIPINATNGRSETDGESWSRSLDLAATNILLESGYRAVANYMHGNRTSLLRSFVGELMSSVRSVDVDRAFRFVGVNQSQCKKKIICDVFETLSRKSDYKSRFLLWIVRNHLPQLRLDFRDVMACDGRSSFDCNARFGNSCPISLSSILKTFQQS